MTESTVNTEYFLCNYCGVSKRISALRDIKPVKNNPTKVRRQCGSCFETAATRKANVNSADSHRRFNSKLATTNVGKYISNLNLKGDNKNNG